MAQPNNFVKNTEHFYVVIMAGGTGTRLWPLSRTARPKQFQSLISDSKTTLLEDTWNRIRQALPNIRHLFVSTTEAYIPYIRDILPDLPQENILTEPLPRGTAAANALCARTIALRDPEAIIATIASDHAIGNPEEFTATLLSAFETASIYPEKLVTIGINPTYPDTGFGYIRLGKELGDIGKKRVFEIDEFKEKPSSELAKIYLKDWRYLWNAGYFVFHAAEFAAWEQQLAPDMHQALNVYFSDAASSPKMRNASYHTIKNEPIDTLIAEQLPPEKLAVIPSSLEWSDVGNWSAILDFLSKKQETKIVSRGKHIDIGSKHCLILSNGKLIATLGLTDTVIVETTDAILVANRKQATEIKPLLEKIRETHGEEYL